MHWILAVEPDFSAREGIIAMGEAHGYVVAAVATALGAFGVLDADESNDIGIVITAKRLKGIDGFDFARLVKRRYPGRRTILFTGAYWRDIETDPRRSWFDAVAYKPFVEELMKEIFLLSV